MSEESYKQALEQILRVGRNQYPGDYIMVEQERTWIQKILGVPKCTTLVSGSPLPRGMYVPHSLYQAMMEIARNAVEREKEGV